MSEKYLPIIVFEKRKNYDDRLTEGGGDGREPGFVLHGEALRIHANQLSSDLKRVRTEIEKECRTPRVLPIILSTTLNEDAIAKSHRQRVTNALGCDGNDNVIGVSGDHEILSILSNEVVLDELERSFMSEESALLTSSLDGIKVFTPITDAYDSEYSEYRVRLFDYNDFDRNYIVKKLFEEYCLHFGIEIARKVRFTADMYIYRLVIKTQELYQKVVLFEGLYSLEKSLPITTAVEALSKQEMISTNDPGEEDHMTVGVLDSGIKPIGHLSPWLLEDEYTSYPYSYADYSHGTAVASIIEYCDELNGTDISSSSGVYLFSALVYPQKGVYPEDLIENIREAVERNPEIKIWNMSLGMDEQCELDRFSEFGMALDNIQDENNVLIIKSAGNCHNFEKGLPKQRISKSADSIRALTVGSIAREKEEFDLSEPNMPSPFTRIGPGPANIIKPDLVFYGGNAGVHGGKVIEHGVLTFNCNDEEERHCGTSFSTPAVTRIVADLAFLLQEEFDPLLLRALTIHHAKYPAGLKMKMTEKINQLGFGVPVKAHDILYYSPDEITLILRDSLEKGSFIEMFNFPYPTSMVDDNGLFRGQIILTLVNKTLVDEKQSGEYCQSNIDVFFGTYSSEKERDISKPIIKNPLGLDENKNILNDALYSAKAKGIHPNTRFERECTLVKYGKKYHPVKKYAVDLADMTPAEREKWLPANRKWFLKIEGLFRDFIERDATKRDYQLSQEFCLVLTIRDPLGQVNVYDEVTQQLNQENFIHHNILVKNDIHVISSAR